MTEQFPLEASADATEGEGQAVDAAARLSSLTQRTPSLSIYTRREASAPLPPPPSTDPFATAAQPAATDTPSETLPPPAAAPSIGQLTHVPAADLWPSGAAMAAWLASAPSALPEAVAMADATFSEPDGSVLVGTRADGRPASVVCELGTSSDEGLGSLLRVAAVQDGGTVVWVVGDTDDSHVAALSWLNRETSPRFMCVRVSGVRIGGSASAPMFDLVVRPPRGSGEPSADAPRRRVEDHLPTD